MPRPAAISLEFAAFGRDAPCQRLDGVDPLAGPSLALQDGLDAGRGAVDQACRQIECLAIAADARLQAEQLGRAARGSSLGDAQGLPGERLSALYLCGEAAQEASERGRALGRGARGGHARRRSERRYFGAHAGNGDAGHARPIGHGHAAVARKVR